MFRLFPVLGALFLAVPFIEIALFVVIGERIGLAMTLLIVVLTGIMGASLISWQGLKVFETAQRDLAQDRLPVQGVLEGVLLLVAALMLITPGFATDVLGLSLAIPAVRSLVAAHVRKNMVAVIVTSEPHPSTSRHGSAHAGDGRGPVIEGEVVAGGRERDDERR